MKKRTIFNICSIIFLVSLVFFYGYRLVYYYILEHKTYDNKIVYLYEKLIDSRGIVGTDRGLVAKDNGYIFASKSVDNYLYYAGRMWQIVNIDEHKNIKLITEKPQTLLTWNSNTKFNDSDINIWLNKNEEEFSGIFESSLKENVNKLMKQNNLVATLLTKNEYSLLASNNYLVNEPFWIIGDDDLPLYVDSTGNIITEYDDTDFIGVKPTIVLSSDTLYLSGNGTIDNPYIIENHEVDLLNKVYVGEYVNYSGYTWRVIGNDDNKTKLVLDSTIENILPYSKYDNEFYLKEGIGLRLNTEVLNNLTNSDYIIPSDYYIGSYTYNNKYSYLNTFKNSVQASIGLLGIGDFYINEIPNTYTLTPYLNTKKTLYTINANNRIYADLISSIYNARIVLYIDSNLFVIEGNGTKLKPYEIGR